MAGSVPGAEDGALVSAARVYDFILKGPEACMKGECYAMPQDRALARKVLEMHPGAHEQARANRRFIAAAAADAHQAGIRQALDLGAGLPAEPSVDRAMPGARVVYLDSDPFTVPAWAAARRGSELVSAMCADLSDTADVLSSVPLDLTRPAAIILGSVIQLIASPHDVLDAYKAAMAPGSRMILSAICYASGTLRQRAEKAAARPVASHSRDDIEALLDGLRLLPPGVTEARAAARGIRWVPRKPGAVMLTAVAVKDLPVGDGGKVTPGRLRGFCVLRPLVLAAAPVGGVIAGDRVLQAVEDLAQAGDLLREEHPVDGGGCPVTGGRLDGSRGVPDYGSGTEEQRSVVVISYVGVWHQPPNSAPVPRRASATAVTGERLS